MRPVPRKDDFPGVGDAGGRRGSEEGTAGGGGGCGPLGRRRLGGAGLLGSHGGRGAQLGELLLVVGPTVDGGRGLLVEEADLGLKFRDLLMRVEEGRLGGIFESGEPKIGSASAGTTARSTFSSITWLVLLAVGQSWSLWQTCRSP